MNMNLVDEAAIAAMEKQFKSTPAYPRFCIDNFLTLDFANLVHAAFPSYREAQLMGLEFNALNEKKKTQITDPALYPEVIKRLYDLLTSQEFISVVSKASGIDNLMPDMQMQGGGIHETNSGGRLDVHVDFNYNEETKLHRRVNLLFYFNKDWLEEYGGYLDLWDESVSRRIEYIAPIFNRAVGFVTSNHSWHGVTPLTGPLDKPRKSFAIYYYTKEAPAEWDGIKHNTIFMARPTEHVRGRLLMPAEKMLVKIKSLAKRLI